MKLIVGLGNPGKKYQSTWHNVGFLALDELAKDDFPNFKTDPKFKAELSEGKIAEEKIILAKPQTFMNNSGQAVQAIASFYKINPENIWVVHDEFDLPLGKIRISHDSSSAGHNGISSVIQYLKTKEFVRFRVGIRPNKTLNLPANEYILKKIGNEDKLTLRISIAKTLIPAIEKSLSGGIDKAMSQFN